MGVTLESCWIPSELATPGSPSITVTRRSPAGDAVEMRRTALDPAAIARLARGLRAHALGRLKGRSVASIVTSLDRVASAWLDPTLPERRLAIVAIARGTGFSEPMVAHAIDLEFESSRGPHLLRALESELGDPAALDGFVADRHLGGRLHAVGPVLVGGVASSNIPGLPHLIATRALLVKAACLIRSSRDELVFLPLFAQVLARIDPELASCLAVVDFDPEDVDLESAFLQDLDHLIAFGGVSSLNALRERLPARVAATWHGHRLGFALICREALEGEVGELADRLAYDFSLFDREACLSPQVAFVETAGATSPRAFAERVAEGMAGWAVRLPPARASLADRARFRQELDSVGLRAAAGDPVEVIADQRDYAVVLEHATELAPAPRGRYVRIVPIEDASRVGSLVEPLRAFLQVAVVEGSEERLDPLRQSLAALGVSRFTAAGLAGLPSMMWRHDGLACLGSLIRWVGEERTAPRDR